MTSPLAGLAQRAGLPDVAAWADEHAWSTATLLRGGAEGRAPAPEAELYAVGFSGGKDSVACVLDLLERGVPRERIELWHHVIDPPDRPFMDWPCTHGYVRAFARALGLRLLFSGREGGFEREMLRDEAPTAPVVFETPGGAVLRAGGKGPRNTRLRFPQTSADLSVRWCSAYLKIDVAARVFANDPRFAAGRFVLVTGERAEESAARAKYATWEEHRAANRARRVYQWRSVHGWPERDVWAILERWGVLPHPAYRLGFGRVSCMSCIFGNPDQWATVAALAPAMFDRIARYEESFGSTIRRRESVREAAARGRSLLPPGSEALAALSQRHDYDEELLVGTRWRLPAGAFRKDGGPI